MYIEDLGGPGILLARAGHGNTGYVLLVRSLERSDLLLLLGDALGQKGAATRLVPEQGSVRSWPLTRTRSSAPSGVRSGDA